MKNRVQQPVSCSGKSSFKGLYRAGPGRYTQTPGATPRKVSRILQMRRRVNGKTEDRPAKERGDDIRRGEDARWIERPVLWAVRPVLWDWKRKSKSCKDCRSMRLSHLRRGEAAPKAGYPATSVAPTGLVDLWGARSQDCVRRGRTCPGLFSCGPSGTFESASPTQPQHQPRAGRS